MNTQFNPAISYNSHFQNRNAELFDQYRDQVAAAVSREGSYRISPVVYICGVTDKEFLFTGNNWNSIFEMPFSDILKLNELGIKQRSEAKIHPFIPARVKLQATYYIAVLHDYRNFMEMAGAFRRAVRVYKADC